MRIWMVSLFEPVPSDGARGMRLMGQAAEIVQRGHDLTVWTTSFAHYGRRQRTDADALLDLEEGYRVRILRSWSYQRNISVRRFAAHQHFAWRLRRALPTAAPPDLIVAYLPPSNVFSVVASYAKRRGIPLVGEIIDPWPDVFVQVAPERLRPLARLALTPLFRQTAHGLRQADALTSISSEYIAWARRMGVHDAIPTRVFYPAVDVAAFDKHRGDAARDEHPGIPTAIYAGSLGRTYDVETIIDAAALLDGRDGADPTWRFVIAGAGTELDRFKRQAAGLSNVRFTGWLEAPELAQELARAHVGLACYRKGATQTVTYKLFDYLAAGLPIVCSLSGEMADILTANGIGLQCRPEDAADLARALQDLADDTGRHAMSARARDFAETDGDTHAVYARYADFLEGVAKDARA